MRQRKLAAALALVLAAGSSSVARGSADVAIEARQHFELGQKYFTAGDYEAAIGEFKRAYVISPAPGLLFNIAQAYRARKDNEQALFFYRSYLTEDPYATERDYVEARIDELRASQTSQRAIVAAAAARPAPEAVDAQPGRGLKIAGIAFAGGGLALAGVATVFGVKAVQASNEISGVFQRGGSWSAHEADVYASGQRYQTTAWVLGATGVAALATGGILYYLGSRQRSISVGTQASPTGGSVAVTCAF